MLDMKFVRENPEVVEKALKNRNNPLSLDGFLKLEQERRSVLAEVEVLKNERNQESQEISRMKRAGENADEKIAAMRAVGDKIAALDERLRDIEQQLKDILMMIPNVPHFTVPVGADENDNPEIRRWGVPKEFSFEPKAHWDVGEGLNILDFERGGKVSGARFTFCRGLGARLERALYNFMLNLHTEEHGYTEIFPPYIVNRDSMLGTGQLPKFAEDMFKLEGLDYYLIPTAEVPVTNYHRGEILSAKELPIRYAAYSACFRAEAGAAGRDTRGLIR